MACDKNATDLSVGSSNIGRHRAVFFATITLVAIVEVSNVIARRIIIEFLFNEHVEAIDVLAIKCEVQ